MAIRCKNDMAVRRIQRITYVGMAVNVALSVVKVAVGLVFSSLAMVADGIHSLSDLVTDLAVLLGLYLGARKPDKTHPYGHGRLETFSAVLVAVVLIVVGGAMIYYATLAITRNAVVVPRWPVLAAAVLSILAKEALYRVTRHVAVKSHSTALYANAWHHRSDALSSVAVLIGYAALYVGFDHGDQVAAIAVGLMIIFVGVKVVGDALRELTEGVVDPRTIEQVMKVIDGHKGVRQWHRLRSRTVGRELFLDVHILVDPALNVATAHEISERLEETLDREMACPVNLTVHIEPDLPAFRKQV
ncbi:MAG TPA: cation diffusion facilitator family transporter [Sedimentisphaerales bacterium]|nr:cation diffusion facilitator family transporter [Sedimentisphaerales bacterium]HRS09562.1 cation diffusion facilitator family transporter [Sedimentisphaerales bacterium]HRV46259.1 cation diffusion facilitator family transporter [Sedimentisphaerales bacterium]